LNGQCLRRYMIGDTGGLKSYCAAKYEAM
jgi:hypothetical protein